MAIHKSSIDELEKKIEELEKQLDFYKAKANFQSGAEIIKTQENLEIKESNILQKAAEENLNLLVNVTDNLPANIAVVDVVTLKYKFVNTLFTKSFNKSKEEIVGSHISDIIGQSNTEFAMKYIEEVRQGRASSYVNTFKLAHGNRYVHVSYAPGFNENSKVVDIIVLSQDITSIKESEEALIEAKEKAEENMVKWLSLTNNTNDTVIVTDREFIIHEINKGIQSIKKEDVLGNSIFKYVMEEHHDIMRATFEKVVKSKLPGEYETKLEMAAFESELPALWFVTKVIPILQKDVITGFILMASDTTERKTYEFKLKSSEELWSSLVINSNDTIQIIDNKLNIKYLNKNLTGVPESDVIGTSILSYVPKEYHKTIDDTIKRVQLNGIPEKYLASLDMSKFVSFKEKLWFSVNVVPIKNNRNINGMILIATDITNQKRYEEELREAKTKAEESEEKYKSMVSILPDGVIIHQDGKIIFVNQAAGEIMKSNNPDALIGTWAINFVHPDYREMALERIKRSVVEKTPAHAIDEIFIGLDGNPVYVYVTAVPFQFEGKTSMLTVFTDITELKLIENELRKAKEQAEESDRLKTAFLQNMSHEIRTPMNAIIGFSSLLNKNELTKEKRNNYTSIIMNSTNQLLSIVSDILTISSLETKQEKLNIGQVCINNIIVDLLAVFKQQAINQNVSIYSKQQLTDKESEIYTDGTKVTQIITNLITNALKFTHKGFIEFGYTLRQAQGSVRKVMEPVEIQFYVKDTGIGIKADQQEKIFERFRQADIDISRRYGGTGLGLSISKGFVELLGGEIWVESEIEKGSTFYFSIPYNPVNELDITKIIIKHNQYKSILIAEDEEYNYLFIEEILNDLHCKLIHAKNGQEAIDFCKTNPDINMILMDIKMPGIDGYTAAYRIKEFRPDLIIIAQTAYALEHEKEKYRDIFDEYITKPINQNELKQKVMKYIDKSKFEI